MSIPKIILDPDNPDEMLEQSLVRMRSASGGTITDFREGSVPRVIAEGLTYITQTHLWYLNLLPEATALEIFRLIGVQRYEGTNATGTLTFRLKSTQLNDFFIPQGFRIPYRDTNIVLQTPLTIPKGFDTGDVSVKVEDIGSIYNLSPFDINESVSNLPAVDTVYNTNPFTGGSDLETLEDFISQASNRVFNSIELTSLVTVDDYVKKAEMILGSGSKAEIVKLLTADKSEQKAGNIHLFCTDAQDLPISSATCQMLKTELTSASFPGAEVNVSPVKFFNVDVEVLALVDTISDSIADSINETLKKLVKPSNLKLGATLMLKNVDYAAFNVEGVTEVISIWLNNQTFNLPAPDPYSKPQLGIVTLSLKDSAGYSETFYYGQNDALDLT